MIVAFSAFVQQHDVGRLLMATLVCVCSSLVAFRLHAQMLKAGGLVRAAWLLLTAAVAGAGAWGAHIMALLAFDPGLPIGFAPDGALYSLMAGVAFAMGGFWIAGFVREGRAHSLAAGIVLGLGFGAMHYISMSAYVVAGRVVWSQALVGLSIALAVIAFSAAALVAQTARAALRQILAAGLMSAGVLALHFTGMAAIGVLPPLHAEALAALPDHLISPDVLWCAVAIASALTVLGGLGVAIIEQQLTASAESRIRRLADAAREGLVVVRGDRIVDANAAFCGLVNGRLLDLIGAPLEGVLLHYETDDASVDGGRAALLQPDDGGSEFPVTVFSRALDPVSGDGGAATTVFAIRDLRERRAAEEKIRYLAEHDGLTGLANRNAMQHRLKVEIDRAGEDAEPLALICIDLDRFKEINDVHGHQAGDALLVEAARRLRSMVAAPSFVARLGGDEFVVVHKDTDQPAGAAMLAADLIDALSEPMTWNGQEVAVGATIGISLFPEDGDSVESLMANADLALYRAKEKGRGGFRFFKSSMDEAVRERRALARDLKRGIEAEELLVFYQPLARASDGSICSFEALVRWRHPIHGMVPPGDFIDVAEESGLIGAVGEYVLRRACAEAASWPTPRRVAVNLSPIQLHDADVARLVHEVLISTGLSPSRLELEVTESALFGDYQRALDNLRRLKALGVRIAMDDFGTGFSSLSTLHSFPFDKLKIDKSFVFQMHNDERAAVIVRAVLGLGRSLGIPVVAEGVETEEQIEFLRAEGCDELQGYAIGRPSPPESLGPWLAPAGESAPPPTPVRNRTAA